MPVSTSDISPARRIAARDSLVFRDLFLFMASIGLPRTCFGNRVTGGIRNGFGFPMFCQTAFRGENHMFYTRSVPTLNLCN